MIQLHPQHEAILDVRYIDEDWNKIADEISDAMSVPCHLELVVKYETFGTIV